MNQTEYPQIKAVIFDMDGTLLDTLEDIGNSVNIILKRHGFPTHSMDKYKYFVGSGIEHLMKASLPPSLQNKESADRYLDELKVVYRNNLMNQTKLYDGIAELLDQLSHQNYLLGIFTNKPHTFAVKCYEKFLSNWNFQVSGVQDDYPPKPDPIGVLHIAKRLQVNPNHCIYVGDSNIDMLTAIHAGMIPMGVKWGFRPEKELWDNQAQYVAETPQNIFKIITDLNNKSDNVTNIHSTRSYYEYN